MLGVRAVESSQVSDPLGSANSNLILATILDPDFDLSQPASQNAMVQVCTELRVWLCWCVC